MSNSEAEMRQVILHAAEKLAKAKDAELVCKGNHYETKTYWSPREALLAMSYAEAILRLLASYLKVEPDQRANATPERGWMQQRPNGDRPPEPSAPKHHDPRAKAERNAAVVAAIKAGETKTVVAERFGISIRRVGQLVDAAMAREKAPA